MIAHEGPPSQDPLGHFLCQRLEAHQVRAIFAKGKNECGLGAAEIEAAICQDLLVPSVDAVLYSQFRYVMDTLLPSVAKPGTPAALRLAEEKRARRERNPFADVAPLPGLAKLSRAPRPLPTKGTDEYQRLMQAIARDSQAWAEAGCRPDVRESSKVPGLVLERRSRLFVFREGEAMLAKYFVAVDGVIWRMEADHQRLYAGNLETHIESTLALCAERLTKKEVA